jgi:flavin-dependent dehydrogenase
MADISPSWDVVIVGARCSGASLATLLARSGVRVLVLEATARGADMPMSTHYIQPPGMAALDRLGVGSRVREVTPPTRVFRGAMDSAEFCVPLPAGQLAYCVRRSTLDPWLQAMAESAGADIRYQHRVLGLVREGERVAGVVVQGPTGKETLRAALVVGADGPHSIVARQVDAPQYLVSQSTRAGYWHYFAAPPRWEMPWDAMLEHRGDELRYIFRTDGDLVLLAAVGRQDEVSTWGADHLRHTMDMFRGSPTTRALVEGKQPVGKGCGLVKAKYFYRQAVGPGWALVGDAGHFKDFVTGQGMADAFLDAERLAQAIVDGRPAAFEYFWRQRDVATLPLHFDAIRQGAVGYNNPFMRWLFAHLSRRPDIVSRLGLVMTRELTPDDMVPMKNLLLWMGKALVCGRMDVIRHFLALGKQLQGEHAEMKSRGEALEAVRQLLEHVKPVASAGKLSYQ